MNTDMIKSKHSGKFLYRFSLSVWILNLFYIVIQFFMETSVLWIVAFFGAVFFEVIFSRYIFHNNFITNKLNKRTWLDYCLLCSKFFSIICVSVGGISLIMSGGGPAIINGEYCIINHGDVISIISDIWYFYFVVCEKLFFSCCILHFSTSMAIDIRTKYILQNQKSMFK